MMCPDSSQKSEGKVILTNYKKQLAERMVREKAEAGADLKSAKSGAESVNRNFEFNPNDPPEVEMLLAILDPKKKKR